MFVVVRTLGRAWVSFYTAGLPAEERDRRRGEIDSDLYEHERFAATDGPGPIARPVAARFVRGVPADVSWRIGRDMTASMEEDVTASWPGRLAVAGMLVLAVMSLYWAIAHAFGDHLGYALMNVASLIATVVLFKGFAMSRQSPRNGAVLIVVACLVVGFIWVWIPFIPLLLLGVLVFGLVRARRFARENRAAWRVPAADREDDSAGRVT